MAVLPKTTDGGSCVEICHILSVATNYQQVPVDCDEINDFLWADLPESDHGRLYKAVQYVPVATVPPHWDNDFHQAQRN